MYDIKYNYYLYVVGKVKWIIYDRCYIVYYIGVCKLIGEIFV